MPSDLEALGQAIKRAQYRNHRALDTALREVGVSLVQWDALRAVDRLPAASGHDLAVATFQSDQAFGTLANRLVDRGLVVRSAGRGRRLEYSLTDAGRAALGEGRDVSDRLLPDLYSSLTPSDRSSLLETLSRLTDSPTTR